MRGFFLLLLLSNIALIAWQYYGQRGEKDEVDVYRNVLMVSEGLTLLSELPEEQYPALIGGEVATVSVQSGNETVVAEGDTDEVARELEAFQVSEAVPGDEGPWCFDIGNVENKLEVSALIDKIGKSGGKIIEQGKERVTVDNYWVFLPPYPNRKKANEAAEILSRKRVRDFFIVRSGEYENALSLGVFSTKGRAERRYQEIVALKARLRKPRIEILEVSRTGFRLSYQVEDPAAIKGITSYLKKKKLSAAKEISCK